MAMPQKAVAPEVSQEVRSVAPAVWKIVRRKEPPWALLVDQWVDRWVDQWADRQVVLLAALMVL